MAEAGRQAGRVARKERGRMDDGREGEGGRGGGMEMERWRGREGGREGEGVRERGSEGARERGREGGRDEMA